MFGFIKVRKSKGQVHLDNKFTSYLDKQHLILCPLCVSAWKFTAKFKAEKEFDQVQKSIFREFNHLCNAYY